MAMVALLLVVVIQLAIVLMRYVLGMSFVWLHELAIYAHAITVSVAGAAALLSNRHVRVDVFSSRWTQKRRLMIERFGFFIFALPLFGCVLFYSVPYVVNSWVIWEGSREVSGLPGLFLVKSIVLVFAVLMLLAGLMRFYENKAR